MAFGSDVLSRVRVRLHSELSERYKYLGYWDDWYMERFARKVLIDYLSSVRPIPCFSLKHLNGNIQVEVWLPDEAY